MQSPRFILRLGLFVAGGFAILIVSIFLIGKQKNLFDPVFNLSTTFYNVSGLQVGNNIRFSGINVGTVGNIVIINDSTVKIDMIIKKNVQQFIKSDCQALIGSEGIIGDRIVIITQGSPSASPVSDGQIIPSVEPVETDAIIASLKVTAANAEIISMQLAEILFKINHGDGTLGRLIEDSTIADNIAQTIINLKKSSVGLDENMEAAKHNFLLRGYFNKKDREAEKLRKEVEKLMEKQKKLDEQLLNEQKKSLEIQEEDQKAKEK